MGYSLEDKLEIRSLLDKIADKAEECFALYEKSIEVERVLIASNIPLEMHNEYENKSKDYEKKIQETQDIIESYWKNIDEIKDKYRKVDD
ncbi:MAG: hypothetical protein KJ767_03960 [Nanoarchaeota archaeon]|nr:hypothetical protein [Nanoarchaeota archaeon]